MNEDSEHVASGVKLFASRLRLDCAGRRIAKCFYGILTKNAIRRGQIERIAAHYKLLPLKSGLQLFGFGMYMASRKETN